MKSALIKPVKYLAMVLMAALLVILFCIQFPLYCLADLVNDWTDDL